jgi:hypothetical protein
VRWEWFLRPGEIFALSGFYKIMKNPLERVIVGNADFPSVKYENVDEGRVWGMEIEFRKDLDQLSSPFKGFKAGINMTLVESKVDLPTSKKQVLIDRDPNQVEFKKYTRPLQGQSPFLLNLDLSYDNNRIGSFVNLHYNLFGERLAEVGQGSTPDVYEKSRGNLTFMYNQRILSSLKFVLNISNILDESIRFVHTFRENDYVRREYKIGRRFKLGFSYEL